MKDSFPAAGERFLPDTEATWELGEELGEALEAGDLVVLRGPLGAGKTTITQGIARGMGVRGRVTSPTFIIAREHPGPKGRPGLIHVDAYRLLGEDPDAAADPIGELDALDLESRAEDSAVVAEWGGGLVERLAERHLVVDLERGGPAEVGRRARWRTGGPGGDNERAAAG